MTRGHQSETVARQGDTGVLRSNTRVLSPKTAANYNSRPRNLMPQTSHWPATKADAQDIHNNTPPDLLDLHPCKVCNDPFHSPLNPISHRRRSFCSRQCYNRHAEKNPGRSRWLISDKGKAVAKRKQTKYEQSELGRIRKEQYLRWRNLVLLLDPSQRPQPKPNLDPWPICTTHDCHNIPRLRLSTQCSGCRRETQLEASWTNAGKPCVVCSRPLTRYQRKTCSDDCEKDRVRSCPKLRANRRKVHQRRRARKHAAFVENVDVMLHLQWQDGKCYHCNHLIRIDKAVPHPKSLTLDHLVPLALGGEHSYANTVASCFKCNCAIKGVKAIGEQLKLV